MTDYIPPDYDRILRIKSEVADDLKRAHRFGGLWRKLPGGQKELGEAYLDGSRKLILHCRPLMDPDEQDNVEDAYNAARDKKEKLHASGVSVVRGFRVAREFKRLSKESYHTTKKASDRALDNKVVGPLCRTDPPAGAPPATPRESDGAYPPEEPDRPPPHDPFTDLHSAASGSQSRWMQDIEMMTLPSGVAGIEEPMDDSDVPDSYSFYHDPDFASSGTSIASHKTERTINSRKSRYNARPRHKYADCGPSHLGLPQGLMSLDIDDASTPEAELMDESPSTPLGAQPISPNPESVLESRPGPSPGTQEPATEHVHCNSQPPSPHQGVESLPPSFSVSSLNDADIFGSDSETGKDD